MNQLVQQSMLSPNPLLKTFLVSVMITLFSVSCSKKETVFSPGKPLSTTKNFQFNVTSANQFDEETSKKISLKLRLTISGINLSQSAKEILWDTVITKENLFEFTHKKSEIIGVTITASPDLFRNMLFGYTIIYNHHGTLLTRSESTGFKDNDLTLKL